jgi:hypothetical protein
MSWLRTLRTTFSNELNEDDFFSWVDWVDREWLFRLNWIETTFSTELNEDDFVDWIEWERLFRLSWMRRLFRLSWMKITFLNKLNENVFFSWKRFVLVLEHSASYARYQCKDFCFTKSSFLIWLAGVNVSGEWCQHISGWCQFIITLILNKHRIDILREQCMTHSQVSILFTTLHHIPALPHDHACERKKNPREALIE